ncbi:MAG TPA: type II toxin-antitoxin system PemK/MazF family toxin [Candidatus Limnocylindrales bacterium]
MIIPARGRVYVADLGEGYGEKPFLVVSNNARNSKLDDCLAARITTSVKPEIPSVVDLSKEDPLVGRVLCDDIVKLYRDELKRDAGAVSAQTMARVRAGLCHALAI